MYLPGFVLHEYLKEALEQEEEVDPQPDGQGYVQVAVVRVEGNLQWTAKITRITYRFMCGYKYDQVSEFECSGMENLDNQTG